MARANGIDREVAEVSIAHAIPCVEGDYMRDSMIKRRRPVMQKWADFLDGKVEVESDEAKVVPFKGTRLAPTHEGSI